MASQGLSATSVPGCVAAMSATQAGGLCCGSGMVGAGEEGGGRGCPMSLQGWPMSDVMHNVMIV